MTSDIMKYKMKAKLFQIFSHNELNIWIYRWLGNILSKYIKNNLDISSWVKRSKLLLQLITKYNILQRNDLVFEHGSGWLHWYGIFIRLNYNVKITLFDIWDNRQFKILKKAFLKFKKDSFSKEIRVNSQDIFEVIEKSNSFNDLYKNLNLEFIVNKKGELHQIKDSIYQLVVSFHVLEHVPRKSLRNVIRDFYRILKPGGYSIHQIGIDDHLAHGTNLNKKFYLSISKKEWDDKYNNIVQHINLVQKSEYLKIFNEEGFELVEIIQEYTDINNLRVHHDYSFLSEDDVACTQLTIIHKKVNNE